MYKLTAQQAIKYIILDVDADWQELPIRLDLSGDEVDNLFDNHSCLAEATHETRHCFSYETGLPCEDSRHYESKSVAAKAPNGQWVGWTYWYGGGKHGQPEEIDWIKDAYLLNVKETQKTITERTFSKVQDKESR